MPNIKSAIKRVKIAKTKTMNNNMVKSEYKTAVKKYEEANANGEKTAEELLRLAKKSIDQAASKGVISKNAASRKKSNLDKKLATKSESKKATAKKVETKKAEAKEDKEEAPAEKPAEKKTTAKKTTKKTTKKAE